MTDFSKIKRLFGITEPKGFAPDDIQTIKSIHGKLPLVLIDYYSELGAEELVNQTQDSLILPGQFDHFQNDDYLIFYRENQRACVWGIQKRDLSLSDPPVYASDDEKSWHLECERLSDFLLAMAYLQALFALEYRTDNFPELNEDGLKFIQENFQNKGVSFRFWTTGIEFYGNYEDSIIAVMGGGSYFSYYSRDKNHFDEMDNVLSVLSEME